MRPECYRPHQIDDISFRYKLESVWERNACKERASEDHMIESTHKCADQTWIHWAALGLSDISVQAYLNQPCLQWLVSSQPHFVLAPLHDPTRSFKNYMKNANRGIMWKAKQINHVFCMPRYLASIVRFENVCSYPVGIEPHNKILDVVGEDKSPWKEFILCREHPSCTSLCWLYRP